MFQKEGTFTYLANPETYCERISTLIQNGTDEWQNLWQLAIKELFHNSEIFQNPVNNINAINILLKVIEKAFKERVYRLRVQAFECWQFFIDTIDTCDVSDKLLNVLLIPLCASNHSIFEVLCAKLNTWHKLLDSNLILKPTIMKKGVPNLLKILYGPHALRQASEFDDLVDVCGSIYLKMLEKCKPYETNDLIMGSLERAIPVLTKNENTQNIANSIWMNALKYICKNNWPASQFNYLIKTFQNLVSSNSPGSNALITSFLIALLETYDTFPVGYLKINLALFCRCLFHVSENEILNLMERMMKKCQNENLFFIEIVKTWHACVEEYKNDLHKYWFAAKTCFLSWDKHEAYPSTWVLLLPVEHLHTKWEAVILEEIRSTYEAVLPYEADLFVKTLCDDLTEFVSEAERLQISLLISIIDLCKIILQSPKRFDGVRHVKSVLLAVFRKIPSQEVLLTSTYKSFAPKFVATVLYFIREYPECETELAPITRMCNSFITRNDKDSSELPVVQLIKQLNSNEESSNETVLKPHNGVHVTPSAKPNSHLRTSFLSRLSSSTENKKTNSEGTAKPPSTPKSAKSTDEEVQFIAIKPKVKNSPMTEHQKEIAKSRSYIPALYEDLSQSQSQSDSVSLLANKTSAPVVTGIEYFEEDANLPPDRSSTRAEAENAAATTPTKDSAPNEAVPSSKKSLFKDTTNSEDPKSISADGGRNLRVSLEAAEVPNNENASSKRRATRSIPAVESVEPKRAKRVSENVADVRKTPSDSNTGEEKRQRGRPKKSENRGRPKKSENLVEVPAVNLVENESQNLFVSTPLQPKKSSMVNSPLDSLMNVKNSQDGARIRRKSLKLRSNELPVRSPVATRKRKSSIIQYFSPKRALGTADENAGPSVANEVVADVEDVANNNAGNSSKVVPDVENADAEDEQSEMNNSVIIIEPISNEIISVIDTESESGPEAENANPQSMPVIDDESTFFEDVEVSRKAETEGTKEKAAECDETDKPAKNTPTEVSQDFPAKPTPEESRTENDLEKSEHVISNAAKNDSNAASQSNVIGSPTKSTGSPTKISSPTKIKNTPSSPDKNERISRKESPSPTKSTEKTERPGEPLYKSSALKELMDEIGEKCETRHANADQTKISVSPLSNNTRTSKIMKMACDSQNLSKSKHFVKIPKSPLCSSPSPSSSRITSTNQRTLKILMANNGSLEKPRSSPSKLVSVPTERIKYYQAECTSPGILKKPDLNGSFSSPKSPKVVCFAEQLTATRTYEVEENNYDSCSSDDASNSNLINDDEATSQEVLYSPLLNCSEDVKHIIERLSLGKAAVDLFHRMGIRTVGHLASISTLTAKSIPAGDNRLPRLRKALKDYDEWRTSSYESKGLRIPSARRRILCKSPDSILEISSLIELLDEVESAESKPVEPVSPEVVQSSNDNSNNASSSSSSSSNSSSSNSNSSNSNSSTNNGNPIHNVVYAINRMPTVVLAKLSEQNCPSLLNKSEIIVRLEEQSSPTKATKAAADVCRSPTKVDCAASTSPTKAPSVSPTKVVSSPSKVSSSPSKVSSSPSKESPADKANAASRVSGSPRKSLAHSFECEAQKSAPPSCEKTAEAAVAEDTSAAEDAAAQPSVARSIESEWDDGVEIDDEQDAIEDTDLIYTPNADAGRSQQEARSARLDTCIVSLRSPQVVEAEQAAPSPEIVDAEADERRERRPTEDAVEKESSLSIFSPDVTSRTVVNRQTESQPQASKSQVEERSLFTSDETAAPTAHQVAAEVAPEAAATREAFFGRLLDALLEPFLADGVRRLLVADEQRALAEFAEMMRKVAPALREAREAGVIGADALRTWDLAEFVEK